MIQNQGDLFQVDKRKAANYAVRKKITDALFALMKDRNIADITVTEIIELAGVARASFYRNYSSKENVLMVLIHAAFDVFTEGKPTYGIDYKSYDHMVKCFSFFKEYKAYVLGLYNSNYATVLLEALNVFHAEIAGTMPASSIERYSIHAFIGSLFNIAIAWLKGGAEESVQDMARFFMKTNNLCE